MQIYGGYKNGTSKAVVGNITIPARTYSIPRVPKSVTFARSSDTSQKITWTSDYDDSYGAQPWTGVYVDRRVDDGSWVTIATLGWETTNYSDGSTAAGHKYEYGVRSYNPAGASSRVTGVLFTTPVAPTSVTLTKTSETGLSLSASGGSSYYDSWEYQTQLNEGDWSGVVSAASLPASFDLGGGVVRARVRKLKASGGTGSATLRSAWATSDAVTTTVAPSAPTVFVELSATWRPGSSKVRTRMMTRLPSETNITALLYSSIVGPVSIRMTPVRGESASGTALARMSAEVITSIVTVPEAPDTV